MPLSRDSRQIREWKLIRRTQFRLKQGLDRIRFEEEELIPEVEALLSGAKSIGELPAGSSIEIVYADHRPSETKDSGK